MPEPNLPPLRLSLRENDTDLSAINVPMLKKLLPELPLAKRKQLMEKYELSQMLVLRLLVPTFLRALITALYALYRYYISRYHIFYDRTRKNWLVTSSLSWKTAMM